MLPTWVSMSMRLPIFPVSDSFSDVIMNEHLKLKTVNGHTVWGGVPSGEGTSPKQAQVANFSPPKY